MHCADKEGGKSSPKPSCYAICKQENKAIPPGFSMSWEPDVHLSLCFERYGCRACAMDLVFGLLNGLVGRMPYGASVVDALSDTSGSSGMGPSDGHRVHTQSPHDGSEELADRRKMVPLPKRLRTRGSAKRFVGLLIEAVERDIVCRELGTKAAAFQTDIDWIQQQLDSARLFKEYLAMHDVPEVQSVIDKPREMEALCDSLDKGWCDSEGRMFNCGLKDLHAAVESDERRMPALQR